MAYEAEFLQDTRVQLARDPSKIITIPSGLHQIVRERTVSLDGNGPEVTVRQVGVAQWRILGSDLDKLRARGEVTVWERREIKADFAPRNRDKTPLG